MVSRIVRKLHKSIMKASKNRLGNFVVRRVSKRKGLYLLHYPNDLRDLRRKLLPGDVLLVEGDHGISDWIKIFSSHTWSHCAIFVGEQFRWGVPYLKDFAEDQPSLVEAIIGKGVILGNLGKYENCNLRICRPRNLTR